jgi:tRNA dimethylallyltransferase
VIDPRRGGGGNGGLGVVGDAETCVLDHIEIVGAVADRQRVDVVEVESFGELDQGSELGGAPQNRLIDFAGQLAVANHQFIGAVLLKSEHGGDRVGEKSKTTRDQTGIGAMRAHGRDQLAAAGSRRDPLFQDFIDHADRQPPKQRDTLAQRGLELDFAAHGPFGDGGDMRFQARIVSQFVDAFLADHGGIHVGEQKFLAPESQRLHDNVKRQITARLAQAVFDCRDVLVAIEGNVDRDFVEQPLRVAWRGKQSERAVDHRAIERGIGGIADERDDERHSVSSQPEGSNAVLIAGPTASGKSALALALAQKTGGIIINADSMQVYRDLRVITARPTPEEEAVVPHRLYGHVDAAVNFSVGAWVVDAAKALSEVRAQNRRPIIVGGSGLYFKALTRGLSAVPPIPTEVREAVRARLERDGVEALHAELARRDGAAAERLKPRDRTRIARALEVVEATGRSLSDWHRDGLPPLLPPGTFTALFLEPDRNELYARIDARFDAMLRAGALEEVERLAARKLDALLPAMKAHGVPALIAHLAGGITLEEAAAVGRADTRHYAKRQFTWFRHQLPEFGWVRPEAAGEWLSTVIPGWSEGPDPESRDSGFARFTRAPE